MQEIADNISKAVCYTMIYALCIYVMMQYELYMQRKSVGDGSIDLHFMLGFNS